MACQYCGKEVPFRMRLTGEGHFCCPAHKRLYNDEHSRLGLARLLEEVSPREEEQPARELREGDAPNPDTVEDVAPAEAMPEPELVASGKGLRLWTFPHVRFEMDARFDAFLDSGLEPAPYTSGVRPAGAGSGDRPDRRRGGNTGSPRRTAQGGGTAAGASGAISRGKDHDPTSATSGAGAVPPSGSRHGAPRGIARRGMGGPPPARGR